MVQVEFNLQPGAQQHTSVVSTTEGYISAIQSGQIQPLPTYTEVDSSPSQLLISTVDPLDTRHIPPTYEQQQSEPGKSAHADNAESASVSSLRTSVDSHLSSISDEDNIITESRISTEEDAIAREKKTVISGFFEAIKNEQGDVIELFLSRNLVTANTVDEDGLTPLLAAVKTKNSKIVQQLLDAGAEPDAFGVVGKEPIPYKFTYYNPQYILTKRTPLMLASELGHLPLVKLFHITYSCNDGLVAPDGQIALRLASSNGHREVVDYLPSRRGGGFLRWKTAHRRSLARAKSALNQMYRFIKFFVWDIEKFFLWSCPKHMIVLPVKKGCVYCWTNKERFGRWCVCEIKKGPERARRAAQACGRGVAACGRGIAKIPKLTVEASKACWRGLKKIPPATVKATVKVAKWTKELVVEVAKACWNFLTVELPRITKKISKWIFELLFKRIPKAIAIYAKWLWSGLVMVLKSIWDVLTRVVSAIHTFITSLSLKDILNAIKYVLEAVFVTFPKKVWSWIQGFGEMSFKVMTVLLGCVGMCIWWIVRGVIYLVNYLPRKTWEVICAMGESARKGLHEVLIFFRPKA